MNNKKEEDTRAASLEELAALRDEGSVTVLDVRSPDEFAAGHIEGSLNVPLDRLLNGQVPELNVANAVVTVCARGGARSQNAAEHLRSLGIGALALCGGAQAWSESQKASDKGERK